MRKPSFCSLWTLAALFAMAGTSFAAPTTQPATPPKVLGGAMPLPVDQRIERQNSPSDKLLVQVTHSEKQGSLYVAYVKLAWGDLDNRIKGVNAKYYSNWDGSLKLDGGALGLIDEKIQFDDKAPKPAPAKPAAAKPAAVKPAALKPSTNKNGTGTVAGPHAGSGADKVEITAGPLVEWESGVVGALDGLRIKITSTTPTIHGTLTAGKFSIPLTITPQETPTTPPPTGTGTILQWKPKP